MYKIEVFRTVHGKKSARGNWYEGTSRFEWMAILKAKFNAILCDWNAPYFCCYGIYWAVTKI